MNHPAKSRFLKTVRNEHGISLIEVLVATGVLMILMMGIVSMTLTQQKETKALSEKLAALDLEKLLITTLANGQICSAELATQIFNASGPYVIDTTALATQTINLTTLHSAPTVGATPMITTNSPASAMASHLLVDKVTFKNFVSTGPADSYFADLTVAFSGGVRSISPIIIKMLIKTNPADPANAKRVTGCLESGHTGTSYRYMFTTTQNWTVPPGVKSAFISMAGGGGSGAGWRMANARYSGHSGGFVFSQPVNLIPGESLQIIIGKGGQAFPSVATTLRPAVGAPYFIWTSPVGDDGLGGYPGTSSKVISPSLGTLLECSGGSGVSFGGVDNFAGTKVAGDVAGATTGSGNPAFPSPNRVAAGNYVTADGPGACGAASYGIGNRGSNQWATGPTLPSGYYVGGSTPFGFGSGGAVGVSGCYVNDTLIGTCVFPEPGRDGVVYLDVWQ